MPYVSNPTERSFASAGVGNTALALAATALGTNLFTNGLGGLFNGGNPTANPTYQLSQKDTEIAELKAERYADRIAFEQSRELSDIKQRLAAMEAAAPLREKIVGEQIGFANATIARLVRPMIPNSNVSYPQASTEESA